MKVLTVYAHHNPRSLCHAILERFDAGLRDGGNVNDVVDLHALGFDPVLGAADAPDWIDDSVPDDVLASMDVERGILERTRNPVRRFLARRWIGGRDARGIVRKIRAQGPPPDVAEQQRRVAAADALAFIAPVYFVGFPAILKGWIERVFTLGFAFSLTADGWRGAIGGRVPLLRHEKALIMSTTLFDHRAYEGRLGEAMAALIDEFSLRYPGVQAVEHVYFHAVYGADLATRTAWLEQAYALGRDFAAGSTDGVRQRA